jgi:hypothetical protein
MDRRLLPNRTRTRAGGGQSLESKIVISKKML